MALWKYDGPIYCGGLKVKHNDVLYTHAKTREQAYRNFVHRMGKSYDIISPNISFIEYDWDEEQEFMREAERDSGSHSNTCPHCGNYLADSGLCPLCDNGDYSIYDEINLSRDEDDGNYSEV